MTFPRYWHKFPGAAEKEVFQPTIVRASDGYPLSVYQAGDAEDEIVVIAGPPTIPFLLLSRLAASLSRHFRVIAWETRGGPYLDGESDGVSLSLDRHAKDLAEILVSAGVARAHYVGWCGGFWIICWAVLELKLSVTSISLIAPNHVDGGKEQTRFQKIIAPLVRQAADARLDDLEPIRQFVCGNVNNDPARTPSETYLDRVSALNGETLESTRKWARAIRDFSVWPGSSDEPIGGERAIRLFDELCRQAPILLMHCRDDDIVSYKCSLNACERNSGSKCVLYPAGGHVVAYLNESMVSEEIEMFIRLGN